MTVRDDEEPRGRREPLTWPRTPEEEAQARWEMQWLVELIDMARDPIVEFARLPDGRLRRAWERHLEWLARELYLRQSRRERLRTERQARIMAAYVMSAAAAARLRIQTQRGSPAREAIPTSVAATPLIRSLRQRGRSLLVPLGVAAGTGRDLSDVECEECVSLPAGMPDGDYVTMPVVGDSMSPALHDGDLVLVKLGRAAARGAVVVARHPDDGYVVKRLGAPGPDYIELLSLNPAYPAIRIPRDARLIVGTVVFRWCAHAELRAV